MKSAADSNKGRVRLWKVSAGVQQWKFADEQSDHSVLYLVKATGIKLEAYGAVLSFVAAVTNMLCGVFTIRDSNVPRRDLLIIRQGTLLTFGNAGGVSAVGHWLKAEYSPVGFRGAFEAIISLCVISGLVLVFSG